MKILNNYYLSTKGAAAIEFAFVLPVFLALIFGTVELGYLFWANSALKYGATYGARYAFSHPTASTSTIQNYTLNIIDFPNSAITYTVTGGGLSIDIDGTFTYPFLFLPLDPIVLTVHEHQVLPLSS